MATSGTYAFNLSNGGIMRNAFGRIRVRMPSIRTEHLITAQDELNLAFAEAANKQVNLWKVDQVTVPLVAGQATYDVDPSTVMILDAWIRTSQGGATNDRYISPVSRTDYASYSNKATPGAPTTYWFDRQINPTVTMWPVPDASGPYTLMYFRCRQMQDAAFAGGQTPDLPYRWLDWVVASLAYRLARHYAQELEAVRKVDAKEAWDVAASQDTENVNLSLSPPISTFYRR